jgi:hypothetical protein
VERDGYRNILDATAATDSPPSEVLHVRIPQDFPDLHAEPGANATQGLESQVAFTTLKRTVVRAMHSNLVRESLLCQFEGLATFSKCLADPFRDRCIFHNGEPYGCASCSSTILKLD